MVQPLTPAEPHTTRYREPMPHDRLGPPPRTTELTAGQAADYLGLHLNTIAKYTELPPNNPLHIPSHRTGDPNTPTSNRHRRITLTDAERWARTHLPPAPAPWDDTPRKN